MKSILKFKKPKIKNINNISKINNINKNIQKRNFIYKQLIYPVTSESAMKKIQTSNTLTFLVEPMNNKNSLKKIISKLFKVKTIKINSLISMNGKKKIFVKLGPEHDALDVANKIGYI
ncbi:60S ribosomal protein L23A (nucleomorph) [Guillardia theta]|uniref:60S ribosomal protein L23A n=1 Tax=Guillardia theta TaxID=55529 RepID=Q98RV5_GUITH|nr:60S ribosomal protein L23A [Guillardia theta]AAK39845.1 60S ribosomal protein L23A [Guillardia theta]|mmetsp:Transcript_32906/g.104054  ORF Transcript_32906/g.104054 Transcript_32906/m.104054 type:complete len:118 (+) Transcript_32906:170-523(+)